MISGGILVVFVVPAEVIILFSDHKLRTLSCCLPFLEPPSKLPGRHGMGHELIISTSSR